MKRASSADSGEAVVELLVVAPLVLAFLVLLLALGRLGLAKQDLADAAGQAADAAARAPDAAAAAGVATETAQASLSASGLACSPLTVQPDLASYRPGGVVSVRVACRLALSSATLAGLPGATTMAASATAPIDPYLPGATP